MKQSIYVGAAAAALISACAVTAQVPGKQDLPTTAGKMPDTFWSAKPTTPTPYAAPNKSLEAK